MPIKKTYKKYLEKFGGHYLKIETIYMNSENSKTNEPPRFKLDLTDKLYPKKQKKKHGFGQLEYLLRLEKHQIRIQQQ